MQLERSNNVSKCQFRMKKKNASGKRAFFWCENLQNYVDQKPFNGKPNKLEDFITECELIFNVKPNIYYRQDNQKIVHKSPHNTVDKFNTEFELKAHRAGLALTHSIPMTIDNQRVMVPNVNQTCRNTCTKQR